MAQPFIELPPAPQRFEVRVPCEAGAMMYRVTAVDAYDAYMNCIDAALKQGDIINDTIRVQPVGDGPNDLPAFWSTEKADEVLAIREEALSQC